MEKKEVDDLILRREVDDLILYAKERSIFDIDRKIFSAMKKALEELKMYRELYPYPYELEAFPDRSNPNRAFPPYICPGCGTITHLIRMGKSYCPYCGQKVKVKNNE